MFHNVHLVNMEILNLNVKSVIVPAANVQIQPIVAHLALIDWTSYI